MLKSTQEEIDKVLPYEDSWFLNAHVKTNPHLNLLREIYNLQKSDLETTLLTHYLLSQYGIKKGINIFG